jgi:predicted enzyme related to lactoylglutathione lyase
MSRAQKFYETVFKVTIHVQDFDGVKMGWFPQTGDKTIASGSLIQQESYIPSKTDGALVYFASDDVANELALIPNAGGTISQGKTHISPEIGYMAVFIDTEGNRIALHAKAT